MRTGSSCRVWESDGVTGLRLTTIVDAPLTVAFDVARALGRPWAVPLQEVESVRPERDHYALSDRRGGHVSHVRRFTATGSGTRVDEEIHWSPARLLAGAGIRRRVRRAMQAHLEAYAAAATERACEVVQVVGAAVIEGGRLLVARRAGGPYDGRWEFPGGKVEPDETDGLGLVREIREELGIDVEVQGFLGEVVLDGVVGGGVPGASTLRVWQCRLAGGELEAREHAELRWVEAAELDALEWIAADRPLLPAVRPHLL
jgi:8-oxo-dGTP diphosphatase